MDAIAHTLYYFDALGIMKNNHFKEPKEPCRHTDTEVIGETDNGYFLLKCKCGFEFYDG